MKGILVVGHGSRSKDAENIFFKIVNEVKSKIGGCVEGCFMEISSPDIPEKLKKMYEDGIREVTVLPYFLFNGMHIKEDIPEILKAEGQKYSDLKIYMAKPIEYHSLLSDILLERAEGEKTCI